MAEQTPLRLVIVQPTAFCNIDCSYCYLPDRSKKKIMARETIAAIKRFVDPLPKHDRRLTIAWHAGEPLAAGLGFYKEAFAILDKSVFKHNFQTNGTLVD